MPSERKSKKNKTEVKSNEVLKPLADYASDRLELTKQLFSCLKNKQIKQRLPPNLQNKSIERIQQICLDEILGISTKRLISIINNTRCPENTDSDDSDQLDEHVSLEEISSDSEAEAVQKKAKEASKKSDSISKPVEKTNKSPKEMTMLELLELQARARAIRSQLALEPVTKIDLDSDDEQEKEKVESKETISNVNKEKAKTPDIPKTTTSRVEKKNIEPTVVRRIVVPPAPPAKPVKLKRNYKSRSSNGEPTSTVVSAKEPTPPKVEDNIAAEEDDDDDVIRMEPSPETFFISDSDDEAPPAKKSPPKKEEIVVEKSPEKAKDSEETPKNSDMIKESKETEKIQEKPEEKIKSPQHESPKDIATDDDPNVVQLMSDTELIELHHQFDKEEDEIEKAPEKKEIPDDLMKKSLEARCDVQSDDDVVEINNSSDDEIMNDSEKSAGETSKNSETWEQRWLSSSKTQNILKTTQLASKVRTMRKTKNNQKSTERKKKESEKAISDKIMNAEEGSIEQFKVIKEKSN